VNSDSELNPNQPPETEPATGAKSNKRWVIIGLVIAFGILTYLSRSYLNLEFLAEQESRLKTFYGDNPWIVYLLAFVIYVTVTGLSIPGATILSLLYAWFFGFGRGLVLVSFASTAGATVAFLLSRYLFRDWIQRKFGDRLRVINEAFDREGNFYLFLMRLIPAFPFFVVNAVMGLTKIKAVTFWWVSQLGMLAGTAVYVYAGSRIPDLMTLKEEGVKAVFTGSQLAQITIALGMLGLFPIIAKKLVERYRGKSAVAS
jgi:uncharacterized membrane protein YdjX (TVP38/TMEM64 family)